MNSPNFLIKKRYLSRVCCFLLLMSMAIGLYAQNTSVKGTVLDETGETLIGVNVKLVGNNSTGTVTDIDGNFTISIPSGKETKLEFSFIGLKTKVVPVKQGTSLKVVMEEDSHVLNEVVISVGYGATRRGDLTGAVASVGAQTLKDVPLTSAAEALTGRLAGVRVTTTEGSPDADVQILVRGGGSITQDSSPLYIVDGFEVRSINDIPPGDIQRVDVLKDAATTAIYGSKGANGVVLITTKGGRAGKTEISLNSHWGISNAYGLTKVLSPYEYYYFQKEIDPGNSTTTGINSMYGRWEDRDIYRSVKGTDWQDKLYGNTGFKQSYNVSITGGTETVKYNVSYTRDDEEYIMVHSKFKRDNLSIKLNKKLHEKLSLDLTARLTKRVIDGPSVSNGGKLKDAIRFSPISSLGSTSEEDLGSDADRTDEAQLSSLNDPYYNTYNEYKVQDNFSNIYNARLTWNAFKGFTYELKGSYGFEYNYTDNIWLKKTGQSSANGGQPVAQRTDDKGENWEIQNIFNYKFNIKKDHKFEFMFTHEMKSRYTNRVLMSSKYFPMDFTAKDILAMWNYGEAQPTYTTKGEPSRTASILGRVKYMYKSKYIVEMISRYDGTNVFAPDNRWGFFPGGALAWRVSEEKFMNNTKKWLDDLKLRVGYGTTGNARVNSFWRQDYAIESASNKLYYIDGVVQSALKPQTTLRNENLTWETKLSANVGVDATLFQNRLNVTVDLYNEVTKDLILKMDLPSNSGYANQYQNVGRVTNRGVEVSLNGTLVNTRDFFLGANFNISFNKNKVNKLDGKSNELLIQSGWKPDVGADDYRVIVGQSLGLIYGFELEGDGYYTFDDFTFNETTKRWELNDNVPDCSELFGSIANFGPGFLKLKDQDGDGIVDADNDRKIIGKTQPKNTGGFGVNASWKGIDLAAMFNWSYGGDIYNANKIMASTMTNRKYNNLSEFMKLENRWSIIDPSNGANIMYGNDANPELFREINKNASIWSPIMGRNVTTNWAIEDGSFLRFSNLTIGYTLPQTITRKFGVRSLRVYSTANNLYCWTSYSGQDPEVSTKRTPTTPGVDYSAYPKARSYVFGLNVTF